MANNQPIIKIKQSSSNAMIKQSSSNAMESSYEEVTAANRPGDTSMDRERKVMKEGMIHERDFVEAPQISTKHNIAYTTVKHTAL